MWAESDRSRLREEFFGADVVAFFEEGVAAFL